MADISSPCNVRSNDKNVTFHGRHRKWQKSNVSYTYMYNRQETSPRTKKSQRRNQVASQGRHQSPNHPSYLRLDSTGENSGGSSEDLNGGFSPEIQFQGSDNFSRPRLQERHPFTETRQGGGGLLDKVRSAFVASPRNTARNLTQRTRANNEDERLSSLDSVAEKLSNMNMTRSMYPQAWGNSMPNWQQQHHASGFGGPTHHSAQGQWGQTANVPRDRNHIPIFHPYQAFQGMAQPPLLSSTQNYQQNFCRPPWQHMMDRNHPSCPPFNRSFNPFGQTWHQQQQRHHPPFPWQHLVGPQMMRGCHNQGSTNRQERPRSPSKAQRWNRYRQRTSPQRPQSKTKVEGCHVNKSKPSSPQICLPDKKSSVDVTSHIAKVKEDIRKDIGHVDDDSAIHVHSTEQLGKTELTEKNIAIQRENIERQAADVKTETCKIDDANKPVSKVTPLQRHSSIDLILSDYEVQSSVQNEVTAPSATSDSEVSDSESDADSAVETNADLWESFTSTDDPYNPLCGWRCNDDNSIQKVASPGVSPSSIRDPHADSGTDEGDNWSETDSDDDYDSGDEIPDEDVDANLPRPLQLSDPQLQELRKNLSSTPNKKSRDSASIHHPSVAFILGSLSSSSDDDDDWDTLDDTSDLHDNPLWDSFNRVRDPYSPMEAWKCSASNLSSNIHSPNQPSTPVRKQDSVEGLKTLLRASTEQKAPQSCETASLKDNDHSDGESFVIATLRVYAARDDIDLGSPSTSQVGMKRVASASCLRRIQVTPQNKASKKVRFCPNSSFIILVEKDPPQSCENNPPSPAAKNDWLACARDRMRFKARIDQLSQILDPVLTDSHREKVYTSRMEGYR